MIEMNHGNLCSPDLGGAEGGGRRGRRADVKRWRCQRTTRAGDSEKSHRVNAQIRPGQGCERAQKNGENGRAPGSLNRKPARVLCSEREQGHLSSAPLPASARQRTSHRATFLPISAIPIHPPPPAALSSLHRAHSSQRSSDTRNVIGSRNSPYIPPAPATEPCRSRLRIYTHILAPT